MENERPNQPTRSLSIPMNVPVAIIIAGALIAAAVYFKGSSLPGPKAAPGETAPQPTAQGPVVGEFRAVDEKTDHIRGADSAKITIIEYSDLECPFCKRFHPTMQQVMKDYPTDVRWVYRHFPLPQLHSQASAEANATECASEQGKFWELTDKIYEVTPSNDGLDLTKLPDYAREVGVANIPQFEKCVADDKYKTRVDADAADAETAGGTGTPYSVILGPGGEKIPIEGAQPYAAVKAAIDSLL